jgi:hypothetical protein
MMGKAQKTSIGKHNRLSSEMTLRKQIQLLLIFHKYVYIVAVCSMQEIEPQKQPFISNTGMQQWNNGVMQLTSKHWLSKYTSAQVQ